MMFAMCIKGSKISTRDVYVVGLEIFLIYWLYYRYVVLNGRFLGNFERSGGDK